ncbi:arf-GAP with Rho-GAP domain, ANK repeat and PH domain-containing protein 1-like [Lampris incognitus]|uniref:arf-GAP with Rho-GAP domain, ANK repeat and PH domain-containing protein 1-like n=1 Tax=Lampris incognitus TaxID=2546036 RepID=UPI0024B6035C|nr:arf-GAP with Rho-GAP domain, ANK repeat and PH domain-containing protein 1-like [Lampris incognitus]XP_056138936.1 arf-GAP with Rho-GAP domain, ANK repeat and PH domain-containing protein 1-like [Lampris incognitus]XP_056138937.1 arf-GAP with Rho-GAP domain, ANK repeat and PH domain-containing protein 1-like [Lampris incognitus]
MMPQSELYTSVWSWLSILHLEQYADAFQDAGLTTFQECRNLTAEWLERMGITLPGHQRRILASLHKTHYNPTDMHAVMPPDTCPSERAEDQEHDHAKQLQSERPVPVPKERESCVGVEGRERPIPRERGKPVPKERLVSKTKEGSEGGLEGRPVARQQPTTPREGKGGEQDGAVDGEREKPVPKERTKYRSAPNMNCSPDLPLVLLPRPSSDNHLPPIPPRSTPNCPPQRFTPTLSSSSSPSSPVTVCPSLNQRSSPIASPALTPTHAPFHPLSIPSAPPPYPRPDTLALPLSVQQGTSEGRIKTSPSSPTSSFSSSSSSSAELGEDKVAPPLPPKLGTVPKGPPPIPRRAPVRPATVVPSNSPPQGETAIDEVQMDQTPLVPPRIRTTPVPDSTQQNAQQLTRSIAKPVLPARRVPKPPPNTVDDNTDEYEEPELFCPSLHPVNTPDTDMFLPIPVVSRRHYSLCSDDELLDDDESVTNHRDSWQDYGISELQSSVCLPGTGRLAQSTKDDDCHQCSVIKMGWLDKNPPQGALYYQRRWVKLDVDYLRYFDNEKEVYSKRIISTAFITNVTSVGELKFEVVTHNRTFLFRAENEAERNDWVTVLLDSTKGRRQTSFLPGSPLTPEYQGYLELRGLRSKLYTVVVADKVFLYKTLEDHRIGLGITSIEMNVGNVKDTDRRSFDLTTPYRIFSFIAESEQLKEQWVEAMRNAIGEALSNSEVAERIWAEPSNSFCADCGAAKPDWAAINLCVVVCKRCAGQHRGLGPSISKVRSLKMDRKVWTEELIQVFLLLGNERVNSFWAANIPPSEALMPSSCSEDRQRFITNKYRQGKYRKYHPLYGNQSELDNALCINLQCSDVLETLSLVFCGANVNCLTGMADCPTPVSITKTYSQPLQAEFISHNLNTEVPRSEVGRTMEAEHYSVPASVSHNGFLFKTGSMARAITERKSREEFSRRWCTLNDGCFSYYESDKNSSPNGVLKATEIVCLAVDMPGKHGYDRTFELYSDSERLYLFGTDDPESHKEWVKSIAKASIPANAEPLIRMGFERIGRLKYKDGLNLQMSKVGWFALVGSTLHAYLEDSLGEEIHLRKLQELSIQQDNEVLVLVEKGRTLYIEGERKLDFAGWCGAIQRAAGSGGDTLSQQQLTDTDIPVIVHSCIGYITQCGLTSEGIYRKSGVNSRVAALCEAFRRDARSVYLREEEHQVDDVSNTLKRFFRELGDGLLTAEASSAWLSTAAIQEDSFKISQYQLLLSQLPRVNKVTTRTLVNHLYCIQRFSEFNQMNLHNLAIVFGPTLFQTDGKDYSAGRVIEDLIQHYTHIFEVDEQQLKRQLDEITVIIKVRESRNTKVPPNNSGDFICTVYLEEKKDTTEQHVKIPGSMTAAELTCEILDRRNILAKDKDYWSCWEVSEKEETARPLHHQERVLPILHSLGTDSHLLIKRHLAMEAMIIYLASKVDVSKHGNMKFREERSILGLGLSSGSFHERYFILNGSSLRMYKDIRSNRPERDWPVKNLKVYVGIKKKLRPPTCWGLTVVCANEKQEKPERQQWYLCCDCQLEMREWFATFLSVQCDGDVWPVEGMQKTRVSRVLPLDTRHGNVSLIPLRGSENEMRNSVAAFSQDPLALFRDVR